MTELEYLDRAEALLATVEAECDRINESGQTDIDNQRVGGMVTLVMMQLGEVVFGGVGSGLYGMLVFAVLAVFIQFAPPGQRSRIFTGMARSLRPGGLLLLHGYAPRQVGYGTGGPPNAENMYTVPLLAEAFAGFEILESRDYDAEVSEGRGHSGLSALVDFVARKPG